MQTRTLYAVVAAALLVPLGSVVAEETDQTSTDAETFKLAISPPEQSAPAGASAIYRVHVESRVEARIGFSLRTSDGAHAALSAEEISVAPGKPGNVALKLAAREPSDRDPIVVHVVATSSSGESQSARATLHVLPHAQPRPCYRHEATSTNDVCPKPTPTALLPEPALRQAPEPYEPRLDAIERRLDAIERRVDALFARFDRVFAEREITRPYARPEPVLPTDPHVEIQLADERLTLGEEGRRVALLIENGARSGSLPLELRYDGSTGWKIELDRSHVSLRPHEREWVWVVFHPGETGSIEYAVVAGAGAAAVKGVATLPPPSIA